MALAPPLPIAPAPLLAAEETALGPSCSSASGQSLDAALRALESAFGQPFLLLDARTGQPRRAVPADWGWEVASRQALLEAVAARGTPEIIEHEPPLSMLAAPLGGLDCGASMVAVSVLLTAPLGRDEEMASAARVFGVDPDRALRWARGVENWSPRQLLQLAEQTVENLVRGARLQFLEREVHEAVAHARDTYAELGLLHRLTRRLALPEDDGQLARRAVQWLAESIPAECVAMVPSTGDVQTVHGTCPLTLSQLREMLAQFGDAAHRPLLLGRPQTAGVVWRFSEVRELACTPIIGGRRVVGWLVAINHTGGETDLHEFGSVELRLLESVSNILGVHRSNTGLVARQGELFGASVRALVSAIEAKDPYTHGHSERVARVAACLGDRLRLSKPELSVIYLGGLLHDIGKIGVDDHVLNKPGALTPDEFDQVKQHPQRGYDILRGIRQLEPTLPIVLHHHEAWDGSGYPHGLRGDATPLLARVTAVADAFDAMSSDRPYRSGMPDAKVDAILREGAGRQWDPLVIDAFFAARDEVRQASRDSQSAPFDVAAWVD